MTKWITEYKESCNRCITMKNDEEDLLALRISLTLLSMNLRNKQNKII